MPKKLQRKVAPKPVAAKSAPAKGGGGGALTMSLTKGVSPKVLAEFTNQLAVLLDAGIPVTRCLRILEGQLKPGNLKRALGDVVEEVEGGTSLSEALKNHDAIFDDLYTNMVAAGEAGGVQDVILNRLAEFMEGQEEIKSRVKGAMAYPIAVFVVAILVLIFVFIFVIPKFKEIFLKQFGSLDELPPLTKFVINAGDHIKETWWIYLVSVLGVYSLHALLRAKVYAYERATDTFKLRIPLFGVLGKKTLVARFTRTFGTLIQSGVPHLEALTILKSALPNTRMTEAVTKIHGSIREGEGIAPPMGESGIFDDIVINMVAVGEQAGELDRMLNKIAERYEVEVRRTVESTFKFIEPLMLIIMAVIVAVIVFALFTPLLKIMNQIGQRR